jgi:hypothetical protein
VLDDDRDGTESTPVTPPHGQAMEPVGQEQATAGLTLTGVA